MSGFRDAALSLWPRLRWHNAFPLPGEDGERGARPLAPWFQTAPSLTLARKRLWGGVGGVGVGQSGPALAHGTPPTYRPLPLKPPQGGGSRRRLGRRLPWRL